MEQRERSDSLAPRECGGAQGASTSVTLQYALLKSAIDAAVEAIDDRGLGAASEIADLQRRAIAALEDYAIAALRLTEALEGAVFRGCATSNCDLASFTEQTAEFFDCARRFLLAVVFRAKSLGPVLREGARCAPMTRGGVWERFASLTPRQHRTLDLMLTGQPNKIIAYELGVAESTVKAHVGAVIRKLRVRNRAQVIAAIARLERYEGYALEIESVPKARRPEERISTEAAAAKLVGGIG
jgi:DNA-binding CsgD family transcriptional regulator